MIDFEKQPLCAHCCWCVDRGPYEPPICYAGLAYKEDGSCMGNADRLESIKMDSYEYDYDNDTEDDD